MLPQNGPEWTTVLVMPLLGCFHRLMSHAVFVIGSLLLALRPFSSHHDNQKLRWRTTPQDDKMLVML